MTSFLPSSLACLVKEPIVSFAAVLAVAIIIFFWLYELVLATQEGVMDDRVWNLEMILSNGPLGGPFPYEYLYRRGNEDVKIYLKLKKFLNALRSQEISAFYISLNVFPLYLLFPLNLLILFCALLILNVLLFLFILYCILRLKCEKHEKGPSKCSRLKT